MQVGSFQTTGPRVPRTSPRAQSESRRRRRFVGRPTAVTHFCLKGRFSTDTRASVSSSESLGRVFERRHLQISNGSARDAGELARGGDSTRIPWGGAGLAPRYSESIEGFILKTQSVGDLGGWFVRTLRELSLRVPLVSAALLTQRSIRGTVKTYRKRTGNAPGRGNNRTSRMVPSR